MGARHGSLPRLQVSILMHSLSGTYGRSYGYHIPGTLKWNSSRCYCLYTSLWSGQVLPSKILWSPGSYSSSKRSSPYHCCHAPSTCWLEETDRTDVQEQLGSEQLMKTSSPRTLEYTLPGERPRIGSNDIWCQVISTTMLWQEFAKKKNKTD